MFCNQCGTKLGDGSRFCQNCGSPVYDANVKTSSDLPKSPSAETAVGVIMADSMENTPEKVSEAVDGVSESVSAAAKQAPVLSSAADETQTAYTVGDGSSEIGQTMILSDNSSDESDEEEGSDASFGQTAILSENSSENYSAENSRGFPETAAASPFQQSAAGLQPDMQSRQFPTQQNTIDNASGFRNTQSFPSNPQPFPTRQDINGNAQNFQNSQSFPGNPQPFPTQQDINGNAQNFQNSQSFPSNPQPFPTQQNINGNSQSFQNTQGFPNDQQQYFNAPPAQGYYNGGAVGAANNTYPQAYPQPDQQPSPQYPALSNPFDSAAGGFAQPTANVDGSGYAVSPQAAAAKKKREPAKIAPTVVLSIVFGIFVFVFLLSAQILTATRKTISEGGLSQAVVDSNPSEVKIGAIAKSDSIKEMLEDANVNIDEIDEDTTLSELIPKLIIDTDVDPEKVEAMFNETDIMDIFSSITGNYEEYLLTGETSSEIDVDSIMKQIKSHNADFKKYLDIDINEYVDSIESGLNDVKDDIENLNPENALGDIGEYLYIALNPGVIISLFVMAVAMALLIFLITKRFKPAMLTFGIGCFVSGLIIAIVSLFNGSLLSLLAGLDGNIGQYISSVLNKSFFDFALLLSLIIAGVGLLLIVIRIVMGAAAKSKAKKNQAEPVQQAV